MLLTVLKTGKGWLGYPTGIQYLKFICDTLCGGSNWNKSFTSYIDIRSQNLAYRCWLSYLPKCFIYRCPGTLFSVLLLLLNLVLIACHTISLPFKMLYIYLICNWACQHLLSNFLSPSDLGRGTSIQIN